MVNLLFSHHYLKSRPLLEYYKICAEYIDILVDSGAFSAYHSGAEITVEDYIKACKEHYHGQCWQYIQLDKVRNPDASFIQLHQMVDAGLKPMPVLVAGMEFEKMKELTDINEFVCVAGGVGSPEAYAHYRYQEAYRASLKKAKIHALGFLRFPNFYQLPIYSGDSSSFAQGTRFGKGGLYHPRRGVLTVFGYPGLAVKNPKRFYSSLEPQALKLFADCNIDFHKLVALGRFSTGQISVPAVTMALAYINYMFDGNRYNKKIFLAVSTINWLFLILLIIKHRKNRVCDYEVVTREFTWLNEMHKKDKKKAQVEVRNVLREIKAGL